MSADATVTAAGTRRENTEKRDSRFGAAQPLSRNHLEPAATGQEKSGGKCGQDAVNKK
jgi:hypothetical protein